MHVNGDIAVARNANGNLKVWDVHTGEEKKTPEKKAGRIGALSVTGDISVAGDAYGDLNVWDD